MSKSYLNEAFKNLNVLNEDTFQLDDSGIQALVDFDDNHEVNDTVSIIDAEAAAADELLDSYVGKVILDCSVCHSKLYKDAADVKIDDEAKLANVGEECPFCYTSDGFKVVGQVAPYCDDCSDSNIEDKVDVDINTDEVTIDDEQPAEPIKEDFKHVDIETDDQKMTMSSDGSKVTVTSEPATSEQLPDETIAPVSDKTADEIESNSDEVPSEEEDIEDFSEEDFDDLGENYLKEVYDNVVSYKTTNVAAKNNKLQLEGIITFKSGKSKPTSFIFEAKDKSKSGRIRFIGENCQLSRGKKAFTMTGKVDSKKFISESLTYNYKAKNAETGKSTRLYGTIQHKK